MPNQKTPKTSPSYGGGRLPASQTEGPAGMSNRCDNFRRINGNGSTLLKQCSNPARWRIVYLDGSYSKTVKRCDNCVQPLKARSQSIIKIVEI